MPVPKATTTLKKPNSALVMVPKVGRLNPTSRKMFNVMLHETQRQVAELRAGDQGVLATHLFSAPLHTMVEKTTANNSDARAHVKKYLREMRRTEVDWEAPDADSNVIWASMGLLSEVRLEMRNGESWVSWALPPALLMAVSDPERYTPIDTEVMAKLHSYAAIALYEICSRYRHNPTGVTSKNPPEWWIDALTQTVAEIDPVTKQKKRREWRKFKNEFLLKALTELNEGTDLLVQLHEFRLSRAVSSVQFAVQKKRLEVDRPAAPLIASVVLAEHASRLGVPYAELQKKVAEGFSEQRIAFALTLLESRVKRSDLAPVNSIASYFRRLIADGTPVAEQGDLLAEISARSETDHPDPNLPGGISMSRGVFQKVEEAPLVKRSEWLSERTASIKSSLMELDAIEQSRYLVLASESMKKTGMLSALLARKVANGEWKTGSLLVNMISAYGREHFGPDWNVEPCAAAVA